MTIAHRLRIVSNTSKIQSAGLNRAIEVATGDVIVRVDGHTIIAPDYVRRCVEALHTTQAQVVGGRLRPRGAYTDGTRDCAGWHCPDSPSLLPFVRLKRSGYVDTVYMGAWRRITVEQVGVFDERLVANEDYELNYRIRQQGGKIYLSQLICSEYYCSETLAELGTPAFSLWLLEVRHSAPASGIDPLAPGCRAAAVHLLASRYHAALSRSAHSALRIAWVGYLAYMILIAAFSLSNGDGNRLLMWRLPFVYAVIHLAWGTGFWWGIFRQRIPNSRQVRLDQ